MKTLVTAIIAVIIGSAAPAGAECISNYGQTACGYSCLANYGLVRCTQTPWGECSANYGQVVCWDPPAWVRRAYRTALTKAECTANYGVIACGYHCVANYGQVRCAQTPDGSCEANYGEVRCWDPRP